VSFFPSFFFLSLVIYFRYSVFFFFLLWNKVFHALHIITNDITSVFLLNVSACLANAILGGEKSVYVKPIFRSCIYGYTCARIQSQGAVSIPCHVKIKYLFVSLFYWSIFIDSASLRGCYLEVTVLLMMLLLMPQSVSWEQYVPLSFSYL